MIDTRQLPVEYPHIREDLVEMAGDENLIFLDGFDHCITGLCSIHGEVPRVAYSTEAIIETLQKRDGMPYEEATEFFDFNIGGLHCGPYTPALVLSAPGVEISVKR